MSPGKRLIFSLIPASMLLVLLAVTEFLLRTFSPSTANKLVIDVTHDGIQWYETNRSFLSKYFSANSPSIPEFKTVSFQQRKGKIFRIFCLGESSMFGTPYEMTATIPGILRKQLRHRFPGVEFEVINLGASAINSNVILDFARALPDLSPDLILVYMGHNEFYGPDGVGASPLERKFPFLTSWKYRLRELRMMEIVQSWLRARSFGMATEVNLMKQVSEGAQVRSGSEEEGRIYRNFERNFSGILEVFRSRNIPVIVSDIASNLLFPPFASDTTSRPDKETLPPPRAAPDGRDRLAQSTNAAVLYREGRSDLESGRYEEARQRLTRARDYDLLKFRAPEEINMIIRSVCRAFRVPVVSAESALAAASPGGVAGDSVFWEHLHPTAYGYWLIANAFFSEITRRNLVPTERMPSRPLPFDRDSLSLCWLDLAYADFSIQHLTSRWPFSGYHRDPLVLGQMADETERAVVSDVYRRVIAWDEGCYRSAAAFWKEGKVRDALTTYEALLEENPYNFYAHYLAGNLLNTTGDQQKARAHYEISVLSNPDYPNSRLDLGLILVNEGLFDKGILQLDTLLMLAVSPEMKANAYYGLAAAYANKNDTREALREIERAIQIAPHYEDALKLRSQIRESEPHR